MVCLLAGWLAGWMDFFPPICGGKKWEGGKGEGGKGLLTDIDGHAPLRLAAARRALQDQRRGGAAHLGQAGARGPHVLGDEEGLEEAEGSV